MRRRRATVPVDGLTLAEPAAGPEADAIRLASHGIPDRHVRDVDRHFLGDDAARLVLHRIRFGVLLDLVDAGHQNEVGPDSPAHVAALALVAAGNDDNVVTLLDLAHACSLASP